MSLTDMATTTGLSNWQWSRPGQLRAAFTEPLQPADPRQHALLVVVTLAFNVLVRLGVALLSAHLDQRVGGVFRALWLLPRISPSVVYALMWTWAAAAPPFGVINQLVEPFGVEGRYWINSDPWLIVILVNGFVGASFGMLIFTSAIKSIPEELFRAARVDGASAWQIVRRITLPLLQLADPLCPDLPDDEPVRVHTSCILLTTNGGTRPVRHRGLESLGVPHGSEQLLRQPGVRPSARPMTAVLVVMGLVIGFRAAPPLPLQRPCLPPER